MKQKISPLKLIYLLILVSLVSSSTRLASAQADANWPRLGIKTVTGGLDKPVFITHAGDGSGRLFVVEQAGRIQIVRDGVIENTFLDITDRVQSPDNNGGTEEGLLSIAFPPGFGESKGYFYVYYTFPLDSDDGYNRVSRFYLGNDANNADPGSEEVIMEFEHPNHQNHNGGQLAFGPDGYLYIGTGDGGGGGDPDQNAQDPGSLLGKILRIDVESGANPYQVPSDNPFISDTDYRPEIWALGLRNPWRFSFDRQTSDMYIGDVGQQNWEEVDFQLSSSPGGEDYGWNILEGTHCYAANTCDDSGMTPPIFEYPSHEDGQCAITGGYVYRGSISGLQGIYFMADYCSGRIWGLQNDGSSWLDRVLLDTNHVIPTFGEDQNGNLYFTDRSSGELLMITESTATFLPLMIR
jgi:glucose/arabinose dehydrogenase